MENNFEKTDRKFDWNQLLVWIFLAILEGTVSIVNVVNPDYLIGVVFDIISIMFVGASYKLYRTNK